MGRRVVWHIVVGALAAEALAVGVYLLIASQFTTRLGSPLGSWWPLIFPALTGAVLGALVSFVGRRR